MGLLKPTNSIDCGECKWKDIKCNDCFVTDHSKTLKFEINEKDNINYLKEKK